jgi:hypothetical protein
VDDDQPTGVEADEIPAAPEPEPDRPGRLAGAARGLRKISRKKWLIGGVGGLGLLGTIGGILFFLLLFKNLHIKNLFLDYEFAKFNRAFGQRLERAIREAEPRGDANSEVDPQASPEEQLRGANAEEVEKLKTKSETELGDEAKRLEALDRSAEGTGGEIDAEINNSRAIAEETGKTDTETERATSEEFNREVAGEESGKPSPMDEVNRSVEETRAESSKPGVTQEFIRSSAVSKFSANVYGAMQKLQGPLFFGTLACIARDIYITSQHVFAQLKLDSLARVAATEAKYADAQKEGKLKLAQIGAISQKFDNGKESFTQSAGYQRAAGEKVVGQDLAERMRVDNQPGGDVGQLLNIAAHIPGADTVCGLLLKPLTQVIIAGVHIASAFVTALSGAFNFGASDVALIAAESAAVIAGSKYAKALAIDAVLHYGGMLFKGDFSPIEWGNMMGAGAKVLGSDSCRRNGCRQLSREEALELDRRIAADQRIEAKQRGLAWRLWGSHRSVLAKISYQMPTNPHAWLARTTTLFANIFNPVELSTRLGMMTLGSFTGPVLADDGRPTYGIPDYGVTDDEINRWGVVENSQWVKAHVSRSEAAKFDRCFDDKFGDVLTNSEFDYSEACSSQDEKFQRYRIYRLDRRVTHSLVLRYNQQSGKRGGIPVANGSVSASTQQLAQEILANTKIIKSGRLVMDDLQLTAKGQMGTANAPMSATILQMIANLGKNHSVVVNALQSGGTGHCHNTPKAQCPDNAHYNGRGVDFGALDGEKTNGRDTPSLTIITEISPLLVPGSGLGQSNCGADPALPAGVITFADSCDHLHVQVPRGTL